MTGVPLSMARRMSRATPEGEAHSAPFLNAAVIGVSTKPGLIVTTRTPREYSC
jgi:hypothetical protein